uniref:XS domain-containing protein n=1 Tax=Kalanchoe fedtschenkoi TaxID=63787 RepID=A0A7N0UT52_KALFE
MVRPERGGSDSHYGAGVGVMRVSPTSACHGGSVSVSCEVGGIGREECGSERGRRVENSRGKRLAEKRGYESGFRDGRESRSMSEFNGSLVCKDSSPSKVSEWGHIMAGRGNIDEYRSPRSGVIDEHRANRFREFRGREDGFEDSMVMEMERERWLLYSRQNFGKDVNSELVDKRRNVSIKNSHPGLYGLGNIQAQGQPEGKSIERGKYLHDQDRHGYYSDKSCCDTVHSPALCRSSRHPVLDDTREARRPTLAGKVEMGKAFQKDIDPRIKLDYMPLCMSSPSQPLSKIMSPPCIGKPSEHREPVLITDSVRCFTGEDGAALSSGSRLRHVSKSSSPSLSEVRTPLYPGNGNEDGEYAMTGEPAAAENIVKIKYFNKENGSRYFSDYGHCYVMPSPHSDSGNLTPQSLGYPSEDREQALMLKQSVAKRSGGDKYFIEEDVHKFRHNDGPLHMLSPPSDVESETLTPLSAAQASYNVAKLHNRQLSKSRQCLRNRIPAPPSNALGVDSEIFLQSSPRYNEVYHRDQNSYNVEEDVRRQCILNSHRLHGKMPNNMEPYGLRDGLWAKVANGVDASGYSHEKNLRSSMLSTHCHSPQEKDFFVHPHDSVAKRHLDQDLEAFIQNISPHENETNEYYLEKQRNETFRVQDFDDYHESNMKDEDFYIDRRQSNLLIPGYNHHTKSGDSGLHGNTRAIFKDRYARGTSFTITNHYCNSQEVGYEQLAGGDDELDHLSSQDIQCQMLISRSAHIQNKDFKEVVGVAFDDRIDVLHPLPCQKFPSRLQKRLGKPNNSAVRDIKKRLGPAPQILDFPLSKKQKISNSSTGIQDSHEHHQGQGSDQSVSEISGTAELDEDSEKFKEQVHRAFLESAKHLFESSAQQRKYTGLDKYESLRCDICVSSREFKDTHSLAKHAFGYVKTDRRAQHLGLHKALCALMGWNCLMAPNSLMSLLVLPESEHLAVKEDLIIWPPVVILHNSSVGDKDLRKQKIVTIGKLESILQGEFTSKL